MVLSSTFQLSSSDIQAQKSLEKTKFNTKECSASVMMNIQVLDYFEK